MALFCQVLKDRRTTPTEIFDHLSPAIWTQGKLRKAKSGQPVKVLLNSRQLLRRLEMSRSPEV